MSQLGPVVNVRPATARTSPPPSDLAYLTRACRSAIWTEVAVSGRRKKGRAGFGQPSFPIPVVRLVRAQSVVAYLADQPPDRGLVQQLLGAVLRR